MFKGGHLNTPRKMALTGTKEGRQSRYKTTCLLIILILFSVFRQPKQSGNDVNSIMRDMMPVLLKGVFDEELEEFYIRLLQ